MISRKNAEKLETLMTLEYMDKFGIDNVRGGELCAVNQYYVSAKYTKIKDREKYAQTSAVVTIRKGTPVPSSTSSKSARIVAPKRKLSRTLRAKTPTRTRAKNT